MLKVEVCEVDPSTSVCVESGVDTGDLAVFLVKGSAVCPTNATASVLAADGLDSDWPASVARHSLLTLASYTWPAPYAYLAVQGYYRVSACTGDTASAWSLSISSRFVDASVGYINYRLSVRLQGVGAANTALLAEGITNATTTPISRGDSSQAQDSQASL